MEKKPFERPLIKKLSVGMPSKFGMSVEDASILLQSDEFSELKHTKVIGLMGMATFTDETVQVESEFKFLKSTFNKLCKLNSELKIISMGMSGDYELAIDSGSTMIRVGSSIFGARNYSN